MNPPANPVFQLLRHPIAFIRQTLSNFRKNQGFLLAGAIAYYALLSIVPFLILTVIALSHLVERSELLDTLGRYLEWLVPSQSASLLVDLSIFLENGVVIGAVLLVTMLFFSSLAFSVLEKSMSIIFSHRIVRRKRHFLTSALIPYFVLVFLGAGLLVLNFVTINLESMGLMSVEILTWHWSLSWLSRALLYLLGLGTETVILSAIYYFIPVGRMAFHHALIGGLFTASVWEIIRHQLVWYFSMISNASVVYGSLTTAVVALFSMEIIATLLLLGAQVIAEYEQLGADGIKPSPRAGL